MAEKSPAQHLVETVFPAGSIDTNADLFFNEEPAELSLTDPTVVVTDSGGFDPSLSADVIDFEPTVQVRVKGAIVTQSNSNYANAQQKMQDIVNLMIAPFSNIVSGTTYFGSYQQGDTIFLDYDMEHRPSWSANFRLLRHF